MYILCVIYTLYIPLQPEHCTPPPKTRQKNNVPESKSSSDQAVPDTLSLQQSFLDIAGALSSVQRPLTFIEAQQRPPASNYIFIYYYIFEVICSIIVFVY